MACPSGDPSHTHTHTQNLLQPGPLLSLCLCLCLFFHLICLSFNSLWFCPFLTLFFHSSCLLSLWSLSLCFVVFQSCLCLRMEANIWPGHAQTQRHTDTRAGYSVQCGLVSTQANGRPHHLCSGFAQKGTRVTATRKVFCTFMCSKHMFSLKKKHLALRVAW